jgi:hypothetical protein
MARIESEKFSLFENFVASIRVIRGLFLICFLVPRSNHNGVVVAPDVRVIKARF